MAPRRSASVPSPVPAMHLGTIWLHHVERVELRPVHELATGSTTRTIRIRTGLGQTLDLILFGEDAEKLRVVKVDSSG